MRREAKAKLRPKELYISLSELDFTWFPEEVPGIIEMWEAGESIHDIANRTDRPVTEVFLLLLDLASKGHITEREGGIFGKLHLHNSGTASGPK